MWILNTESQEKRFPDGISSRKKKLGKIWDTKQSYFMELEGNLPTCLSFASPISALASQEIKGFVPPKVEPSTQQVCNKILPTRLMRYVLCGLGQAALLSETQHPAFPERNNDILLHGLLRDLNEIIMQILTWGRCSTQVIPFPWSCVSSRRSKWSEIDNQNVKRDMERRIRAYQEKQGRLPRGSRTKIGPWRRELICVCIRTSKIDSKFTGSQG